MKVTSLDFAPIAANIEEQYNLAEKNKIKKKGWCTVITSSIYCLDNSKLAYGFRFSKVEDVALNKVEQREDGSFERIEAIIN